MSNDPAVDTATFSLEVAEGVTTLRIAGDLDLSTWHELSDALDEAVRMTATEMVVDLHDCPFLCSGSLALIEASALKLQERRARLVVRGEPPSFHLISSSVSTYAFDTL